MRNYLFCSFSSLKAIAKRFVVLLVSVVMLLSLTQTAVMAANNSDTKTRLGVPEAADSVLDKDNTAAKEARREWQSKASSIREDKENKPNTLGEKLNVDELSEGYDPEREAEKRSVPTP
jgi:peptidoglycan hydrolase CwlO-like protein